MSEADPSPMLPASPEEGEIVEARPSGAALERRSAAAMPAVQAAAAAAGGFVAGAAVVGLFGRRHRRALDRRQAPGAPCSAAATPQRHRR